ncbi:MAG: NHL repeat-containing protein [Spirochaetales bacterium]|nr:NHL repeat-containing protein [Spirochaetales bacterium]
MEKYIKLAGLLVVTGVLFLSCMTRPPDFTKIPKDLGVVKPAVMFGHQTKDKHNSETYMFDKPKPIAVQSNGNIIVGGKNFSLSMFTADGKFIKYIGKKGKGKGEYNYPKGIAIDADDNIYVGDSKLYKIMEFDKDGNFLREFGKKGKPSEGFTAVGPISIDADGNIYVTDKGKEGGIFKYDNNGKFIMKIGKNGEGKGEIAEAGWTAINNKSKKIFVANDSQGKVEVYNYETGEFLYEFGGIGEGPDKWAADIEGIAIGPWGLVFAVDETGGNIKVFQEDGTFVTKFGKSGIYEGELADSEGLAYDAKNKRVVLADEKNFRVQSWSLESLGL